METFEEKDFYSIKTDKNKNRLYLNIVGHWKKAESVPQYVEHVQKAVGKMDKGFTAQVTVDEDKNPGFGVTKLHKQVQQALLDGGIKKTAVFFPRGKAINNVILNVVGKLSGMPFKVVKSTEEGESWLDS